MDVKPIKCAIQRELFITINEVKDQIWAILISASSATVAFEKKNQGLDLFIKEITSHFSLNGKMTVNLRIMQIFELLLYHI